MLARQHLHYPDSIVDTVDLTLTDGQQEKHHPPHFWKSPFEHLSNSFNAAAHSAR